jgi:hypothetical protein
MRTFGLVVIASLAVLLVPAAAANASLSATLFATTHTPKAGHKWPIKIKAKDSRTGKRACGTVRYAFLFNGKVVGRRNPGVGRRFCGTFSDPAIIFPKRAIGIPLTFRAVVSAKSGQANLDYAVKVRR